MAAERKTGIHDESLVRGDEFAVYVVSKDATVDVLFQCFICILDGLQNVASYGMSNAFGC
jgi:hypothetical protein